MKLVPLKVLAASGGGTWSDVAEAVNYARTLGCKVGNLSFGAYGAAPDVIRIALKEAREILWCAAAGNGDLTYNGLNVGDDIDEFPFYPAAFSMGHVLSVAASNRSDALASFSNTGRSNVDLSAPGVAIYSTLPGGNYGYYNGTSMACAFVAGVAALLPRNELPLQSRHLLQIAVDRTVQRGGPLLTEGRLNAGRVITLGSDKRRLFPAASGGLYSTSGGHHLQILPNGRVTAWGKNHRGQLAVQGTSECNTPNLVPGVQDVISVAAFSNTSFALTAEGTVWSWGAAGYGGLLGRSPATAAALLDPVPTVIAQMSHVIQIQVSDLCMIALCDDGSVWTWGGSPGRIATAEAAAFPGLVQGIPAIASLSQMTVTSRSVHLIAHDGKVYGWGYGSGAGSEQLPIAIPALDNCSGIYSPYAVKQDGTVLSWANSVTPIVAPEWFGAKEFSFGWGSYGALYALMADGTVRAAGSNVYGQLGADVEPSSLPVQVPGIANAVSIFGVERGAAIIDRQGRAFEWGFRDRQTGAARPLEGAQDAVFISRTQTASSGPDLTSSLCVEVDGYSCAWGGNAAGELGVGLSPDKTRPVEVLGLRGSTFIKAATGGFESDHSLVMDAGRVLRKWGHHGVLGASFAGNCLEGLPLADFSEVPEVQIAEANDYYTHVVFHLLPDGTVHAQLTGGITGPVLSVPGAEDVTKIWAEPGFLFYSRENGTFWSVTFSRGAEGTIIFSAPQQLTSLSNVIEFEAFELRRHNTLHALRADGTLFQWQYDPVAQTHLPASPVAGLPMIKSFTFNPEFALVVTQSGQVLGWNFDDDAIHLSILANGELGFVPAPQIVQGLANIVRVYSAAGGSVSIGGGSDSTAIAAALDDQGRVWMWGSNGRGQLGRGNTTDGLFVQPVFGLTGVIDFALSADHCLARKADGSFWAWGANSCGQLCDGSGYAAGANATLASRFSQSVFNAGNGFDDWLTTNFTDAEIGDTDLSGDEADPDKDGVINILEYALGTRPQQTTSRAKMPTASIEKVSKRYFSNAVSIANNELEADEDHMVMTVERESIRSDVDYVPEVSDDAQTWFHGNGYIRMILDTPTRLVVADLSPFDTTKRRFMRLRIVRRSLGDARVRND